MNNTSPKRQFALDQIAEKMGGTGKHIFRNRTNKEIVLPKPALNGKSNFLPGECFLGDSYFFQMLNQLEHVQTLEDVPAPSPVKATTTMLNESHSHSSEELITEIPPAVGRGIEESKKNTKKPVRKASKTNEDLDSGEDQLILEDPIGHIDVILND